LFVLRSSKKLLSSRDKVAADRGGMAMKGRVPQQRGFLTILASNEPGEPEAAPGTEKIAIATV